MPSDVSRLYHNPRCSKSRGALDLLRERGIEPQIVAKAEAVGGDRDAGVRELLREKQPSGRTSTPDEIARTVVWLCDPAAHNLTGAAIPVDGGWTAQ